MFLVLLTKKGCDKMDTGLNELCLPAMLLFARQITPRLQYIANWLGLYLFDQSMTVVTDEKLLVGGAMVFNYSAHPLPVTCFWLKPHSLLFEKDIAPQAVEVKTFAGLPYFFETGGDFSFDILAASFYLLQRYEEYLPHRQDQYGRYAHTNSLAFQHNFLHLPLVDLWMQELKKALLQKFSPLQFAARTFQFIPTYDVDIAFAYRGKGFFRNLWGLYRNLATHNTEDMLQRIDFVLAGKKDPFDVFEELDKEHTQHRLYPIYFLLLAQKPSAIDKNTSPRNKTYRRLVGKLSAQYKTGIHLSGAAAKDLATMKVEKKTLEEITGVPVIRNRMHYLLLRLPETYRQLLQLGITEDYTMGYGTINGFRAGTCTPYFWYDLVTEESKPLQIFPFCYMDAVSIFENEATPAGALQEMNRLLQLVQQVQGCFVSIFHNHFMGSNAEGRRWMEMYKTFLNGL